MMENQTVTTFGTTKDGKEAQLYLLKNQKGMKAYVSDFGASLVRLFSDMMMPQDTSAARRESVPPLAGMPTGSAGRRLRSTA